MELRKLLEKDFKAGHVVFETETCYISSDDDANVGIKFKVAEPQIKKIDNIDEKIDVVSVEDPEQELLSLKRIADVFNSDIYEIEEGLYAMVASDTLLDVFAEVQEATLKDVLEAEYQDVEPLYKDDKITIVTGTDTNFAVKFADDNAEVVKIDIDELRVLANTKVKSLTHEKSDTFNGFYISGKFACIFMDAEAKYYKLSDGIYCSVIYKDGEVPFIGDIFIVEKESPKKEYLKIREKLSQNA